MILLAIDTAGQLPGLAFCKDNTVLYEYSWRSQRNHTVELMPNIERGFAEVGLSGGEVDILAVCTGPGSFNATRVGVTTAKILGLVWDLPVYGGTCFEVGAYALRSLVGDILIQVSLGRGNWAVQTFSCNGREAAPLTETEVATDGLGDTAGGSYAAVVLDDPPSDIPRFSAPVLTRRPAWVAEWAAGQIAAGLPGPIDRVEPYYIQPARITAPTRNTFGSR